MRTLGVATSKADFDEGTIDNVEIGATTAAAGTFTNLTTTGSTNKIGNAATDTIGFYGITPVAQRAGSAQTAVSTSALTNVSATAVDASVAGAFAFVSSTQVNTVIDALSMLVPRVSTLITLTNELRAALVAIGVITGAA